MVCRSHPVVFGLESFQTPFPTLSRVICRRHASNIRHYKPLSWTGSIISGSWTGSISLFGRLSGSCPHQYSANQPRRPATPVTRGL